MSQTWMRRCRRTTIAAVVAAGVAVAPSAAADDRPWTISGSGWGHGVGMSQYGAMEMARDGKKAAEILGHYYSGTSYDLVSDMDRISVNVRNGTKTSTMTTSALSAGGGAVTVTAGSATMTGGVGSTLIADPQSGGTGVTITCESCEPVTSVTGVKVGVAWDDGSTLISVDGVRYRDGRIAVTRAGSGASLHVVVEARIHDEYLDYVTEVPWSWPTEALKAQAAAARGYALASLPGGLRAACDCHVYNTLASQVFAGYPSQANLPYWERWTDAVRAGGSADKGYVVRHDGRVIQAFYSSSSGGRTQNNEDVWTGTPLPYLRSVDDPWSLRPSNPRAAWTTRVSADTVAEAFGLSDVVRLDLSARTKAGAVASATATSSSGATRTITGSLMRTRFGVNSAYVTRTGERFSGADRYATAAAVARELPTSSAVLIVSGEALVDAMVGGPLAGAVQAPLLLSQGGTLPRATTEELDRRRSEVSTAYILGGRQVVPLSVENALRDRGLKVVRLGGADRYDTARLVANEVSRHVVVSGAILADGAALPDVVSASGPAAALGLPVLLTPSSHLHPLAAEALRALGVSSAVIAGGPISDSTEGEIRSVVGSVARLSGPDRYATAAALATHFAPRMRTHNAVVVTSGLDDNLIDALAAGPLSQPMLFVKPDSLPAYTQAAVQQLRGAGQVIVVGGTTAVSNSVLTATRRS